MIKPGEVAYVKFTEEPVFVLKFIPPPDKAPDWLGQQLSGQEIVVRRATSSNRKGMWYSTEVFFIEELESFEEKLERMLNEKQTVSKFAKRAASDSVITEAVPSIN